MILGTNKLKAERAFSWSKMDHGKMQSQGHLCCKHGQAWGCIFWGAPSQGSLCFKIPQNLPPKRKNLFHFHVFVFLFTVASVLPLPAKTVAHLFTTAEGERERERERESEIWSDLIWHSRGERERETESKREREREREREIEIEREREKEREEREREREEERFFVHSVYAVALAGGSQKAPRELTEDPLRDPLHFSYLELQKLTFH